MCGAEEPSNYPFMISSAESMVRFGLVSDFVRVGRGVVVLIWGRAAPVIDDLNILDLKRPKSTQGYI